ncbi:MAG: hypothetical protein H6713_01760 [Myxococcales bacterium]|nr:hypothetical protein [Myxococcales bacterium]
MTTSSTQAPGGRETLARARALARTLEPGPARDELHAALREFDPHAAAFELIWLAKDAYRDRSKAETHERVRVLERRSNLYAALYRDREDAREHVLAFRGSDSGADWITGNLQNLIGRAPQYTEAAALTGDLLLEVLGAGGRLRVTGHSLGGGLASFAAYAHGLVAATFNAAGVHDELLAARGLDRDGAAALVRNYHVAGELVSAVQRGKLPDALGLQLEVPAIDERGEPLGASIGPRQAAALHHVNAACRGVQALERDHLAALRDAIAGAGG